MPWSMSIVNIFLESTYMILWILALELFFRILANCVSSGSSNTCSSTNNNHRHNVPSTTTNCQTTSQSSNQLSTSYGKYSSERTKSKRSSKASKKFKQHKILLCFTLLVFLGVTFLIVIAGSKRH